MNPSSNETNGMQSGIQLPPIPEQALAGAPKAEQVPGGLPELPSTAFESGSSAPSSTPPALPTIPLPPMGQSSDPATSAGSAAPTDTNLPDAADDSDLIEKEWVDKAKKIIDQTRDNPYEQSKEITVFKADYMKKRYNKSIKLSE